MIPIGKIHITKRVQINGQPRYCPAVHAANGRIVRDRVVVAGKEETHSEGSYYMEWWDGARRIRKAIGKDPATAYTRAIRQEAILAAKANGVQIVETDAPSMTLLVNAVNAYLADIKLRRKHETYRKYTRTLTCFMESSKKQYLEEITRQDMVNFSVYLRDTKHLGRRSVHEGFNDAMAFLNKQKVNVGLEPGDWPKYTKKKPTVYDREQLNAFFAACDETEWLYFQMFLGTGFREGEVMHLTWSNVNLHEGTVAVRANDRFNWYPKDDEEREVPITPELVDALKRWKAKSDSRCPLVFATRGCKPQHDFLKICKRVARRAKLDESQVNLHKFRRTWMTWGLQGGIDVRTMQAFAGHSDMKSTMRYLRPLDAADVRDKVRAIYSSAASPNATT